MHFLMPKDSEKMDTDFIEVGFCGTRALGMKKSNEKMCPVEECALDAI